jgi:hypothetical protein
MNDKALLDQLHTVLIASLLEKIRSGEATAGDLGVARQLLKDNGIDVAAKLGDPILKLSEALPFDPSMDHEDEEEAA